MAFVIIQITSLSLKVSHWALIWVLSRNSPGEAERTPYKNSGSVADVTAKFELDI